MKTWHDHMICDPKPERKGKKLDATAKRTEAKNQMRDFNDVESTKDLRFKLDHFVQYIQEERLSAVADFPVFYFFDELRTTFPRAAVLLSSRNATTWATARKLKNNLVCREAVLGSPMEAASAQMSPKLTHPFALMPCLERQLLRGEDPSLAFIHMSELQTNATGVAKLVAAFDAYNTHVRDSSDATKTPFVEIDVANPGTKEGDERIKNEALVKIAEILDPKVKELVKESLPVSGLNISELNDAMFGIPDVRPFEVAALISNVSSPVAQGVVALKAAEALKADESNTSWFAALDTAVKANVTAEREAAAANTIFAARQQMAQQVAQEQATSAAVNAAIQPAAAVNQTASAHADAAVQEELVAQLRTGKALHAAERAAGEALAVRAEAAVAAAERVAQKALAAKTSAMRNSSEAFDQAQAAAEEATAAAEVAAAERALAELKVAVGKATRDDQSSAALAEEKAAQNQLLADKAQAAAETSAAEAAAKADLENAAADKVTEELAKKAESAAAAARAVQDAAAAVQNATEQRLGAIMSATEHRAEKEAAEQAVRDAMAVAPDHVLKVIAAGQSTTSTTWMQDTLCAFGLKTWHDHMMCVPEDATSNATGGGLGHVPFHAGIPMKRFGAFARKLAAHHRMEDVADIGSTDQLSSVLSRFKEFVVGERLAAVADFPVFYFFDELHEAFPRAAILLSVRNSTDWASARRMKNNLLCREAVSDERSPLAEKLEPALPHPFALLPCLARHLILGGRPKEAFVQASDLQNNASGLAKLAAAFDAYNAHVRDVALRSKTPFAEMDVVNGLETDGLVKVAELLTGAPPAAAELATLTAGVVNAPVQLTRSADTMAAEYAKNQTLPVAVICAEVGNSRHTAEFVEYHTSLGFSRIYAYDSGLTDESRDVLKGFAPETVTLLTAAPDEKSGGVDQCIRRINADYGIACGSSPSTRTSSSRPLRSRTRCRRCSRATRRAAPSTCTSRRCGSAAAGTRTWRSAERGPSSRASSGTAPRSSPGTARTCTSPVPGAPASRSASRPSRRARCRRCRRCRPPSKGRRGCTWTRPCCRPASAPTWRAPTAWCCTTSSRSPWRSTAPQRSSSRASRGSGSATRRSRAGGRRRRKHKRRPRSWRRSTRGSTGRGRGRTTTPTGPRMRRCCCASPPSAALSRASLRACASAACKICATTATSCRSGMAARERPRSPCSRSPVPPPPRSRSTGCPRSTSSAAAPRWWWAP